MNKTQNLLDKIKHNISPPRRTALAYTLIVFLIMSGFWWVLEGWIVVQLDERTRTQVKSQLDIIADALMQNINLRTSLINGICAYIESEYPNDPAGFLENFEPFAAGIYQSTTGIRNIALAPDGIMQFVYPYEENKAVLGYKPAEDERPYVRQEVQRAIDGRGIVLSRPYGLIQGGMGIIARKAAFINDEYWGLANLVIDLPPILESAGISNTSESLELLLLDQSGVAFIGDESLLNQNPVSLEITLIEGSWMLFGIPAGGWEATYAREITVARSLGWIIVLLITLSAFLFINRSERLAWLVQERTKELHASNQQLKEELNQREAAELALKNANQTLFNVLESIEADIYIASLEDYRILYMNEHMRKNFGEDLVGKICYQVFRSENQPCSHCTNSQLLNNNREPTGVIIWEGYNPIVKRWFQNADRAIRWQDGNYARMQIATDITNIKQAEQAAHEYSMRLEKEVAKRTEELKQTQDKLIRQEKLATLGELAGGVGHELRNPLGVIGNAVYYLKSIQTNPEPKTVEYLELINAEIHKANQIITTLLDFARNKPPRRESTDVRQLIDNVVSKATLPVSINLEVDFEENLPLILVDSLQMQQVFANLITNAWQAMPEGGRLKILAAEVKENRSSEKPARWVSISIHDTGTGILPKHQDKIFEPLFTTKTQGIGLGLAICKLFVEANGGRIVVQSEAGKGSVFTVKLPALDTTRNDSESK